MGEASTNHAGFYKTALPTVAHGSQMLQGCAAAGTLTNIDLLGPFVLPLGEHLELSVV